MAAYTGVTLPYCALASQLTEDTKLAHPPQRGPPASPGSILSSLVGFALGAAWWATGAPGYLAMGAAAERSRWSGHPLSGLGWPPRAGFCRVLGGDRAITTSGGASAQWPASCASGGCIWLSGGAALMAAGLSLLSLE